MTGYYALRITPYNSDININNIQSFISTISNQYVIGHETEKNDHFHIVYKGDKFKEAKKLYEFIGTDKTGNSIYSCTLVKDIEKAVQYAIKDGDYIKSGRETWEDFVEEMYEISYQKPKSYEEAIKQVNLLYQEHHIDENDLWIQISKLRCEYDLRLNFNQVDELVRAQIYKRNPDLLKIAVKDRKLFC